MKYSVVEGLVQRQFAAPVPGQQDGAERLGRQGEENDAPHQPVNILARRVGKQVLHDQPVADRNRAPDPGEEGDRDGHHAEAPKLDQCQNDPLAEGGEERPGVDDDETGDTDRRGRGEEGVDPGNMAFGGRDVEHEQQGARQNEQKKAQQHQSRRVHLQHSASVRHLHDLRNVNDVSGPGSTGKSSWQLNSARITNDEGQDIPGWVIHFCVGCGGEQQRTARYESEQRHSTSPG